MSQNEITIDVLLKHEQDYQFESFSNETALEIGRLLVDTAINESFPVAIDITRYQQRLFFMLTRERRQIMRSGLNGKKTLQNVLDIVQC